MELSLKEAADELGMPPRVLHAMTWAKTGPKPINPNARLKPTYELQVVLDWLKANKPTVGDLTP